jgi:hypothetical protein
MNYQLTIGHDCEFQLFDKKKGGVVSAIPVLKKFKDDKIDLGDGFYCFADNVNFEVNVPPSYSKEEFLKNREILMSKIRGYLGEDYDISIKASHRFTPEEVTHPEAIRAGCQPEFDARKLEICDPPELENDVLRTCAGHIHIGRSDWKDADGDAFLIDAMSKVDVVLYSDLFVALPSVILDNTPEGKARKKFYGRNSRHRPTDFGVEIRQMSNFWFAKPELTSLVYDLVIMGVKAAEEKASIEIDEEQIVKAIDENDAVLARQLLDVFMPKEKIVEIESLVLA